MELIVTPTDHPCFVVNYELNYFGQVKSIHSTLNLKTKLRSFPYAARVHQYEFEQNLFLSFVHTKMDFKNVDSTYVYNVWLKRIKKKYFP